VGCVPGGWGGLEELSAVGGWMAEGGCWGIWYRGGWLGRSFSMRLLCSDALVGYSPPNFPMRDRNCHFAFKPLLIT